MVRMRADVLLVERGLAETRESARRLIMAGQARVGTTVLVKPATLLAPDAPIELLRPPRYVSRGGLKLEAALDAFGIDVEGLRCLDIGASTGGFTDCLLQRGAAHVLAVDVGRAQLHARLRNDERVELRERVNARDLPELPPIDLFVADVSFISLRKVLPSVQNRVAPGTIGAVLLKPQFEAGPSEVPRGGVIRDELVRERVLSDFVDWLGANMWEVRGTIVSPVPGGDGNIEFFLHVATPASGERRC
jgi:23S rRNA (cytidine1920-2'-O)/16S rRNA (cytidine1409-2'-O)-methyltransferase